MHHEAHADSSPQVATSRPKFETIVTQVEKAHHVELGVGHHGHGHHGRSHGHAHGHGQGHTVGLGHHSDSHRLNHESYELSLLHGVHGYGSGNLNTDGSKKSRPPTPDPIVDTLTYRTSTRVIAVVDIVYSIVMLIFQLVVLIGGSSYRNVEDEVDESEAEMRKTNLTIGVLIWMGMFAVCIVQLLVAGALYGGTNERDARKTLRNCRIWCAMSIFLVFLLTLELVGIVASNEITAFLFPLLVFTTELVFRLAGLVLISKFIKELNFELSDLAEGAKDVHYTPLPSTGGGSGGPSPVHSIASKGTEYEHLFEQDHHSPSPSHRAHGHEHGHGHGTQDSSSHHLHPSKTHSHNHTQEHSSHSHHQRHSHQHPHQHIV